jgi:hypothetical protein
VAALAEKLSLVNKICPIAISRQLLPITMWASSILYAAGQRPGAGTVVSQMMLPFSLSKAKNHRAVGDENHAVESR